MKKGEMLRPLGDTEVGKKIKAYREERGLSQKYVADAVGVSSATVSRWESGEIKNMKSDKIQKLSDTIGLEKTVLLGYDSGKEYILSGEEAQVIDTYRSLDTSSRLYLLNTILFLTHISENSKGANQAAKKSNRIGDVHISGDTTIT